MLHIAPQTPDAEGRNTSLGLRAYLDDIANIVKRVPATWVRCELHTLRVADRFTRMEFIEHDPDGKQIAKVQGGCFSQEWNRIDRAFREAGLTLEAGSQVLVKLQGNLNPTFGFQVTVTDIDLTFALGELNARIQSIRKHLQDEGIWDRNRSLQRPSDFIRVSVIAPTNAAGLGDFRATADLLVSAGLAEFVYYEVPFQTRDAPARIVDALRDIYRSYSKEATRSCAVAIIRGGGASADLAWLIDQKLAEAVCRMNVPVMTGIGHERDRNLLDEIACIACDTPSKVIEYIRATIVRSALDGERAREAIQTHAGQHLSRYESAVTLALTSIERDALETLRLAENTVRVVANGLEPGARHLLDKFGAAIGDARAVVGNNAQETVRIAEIKVRATAKRLEPGARAFLHETYLSVAKTMGIAQTASQNRRELATKMVQSLRQSLAATAENAMRPFELGTSRAMSEIGARIDAVPQSAAETLVRLRQKILLDAGQTTEHVGGKITDLHHLTFRGAQSRLDECQSAIAIISERAEALHPRTVLAAGYTILRNAAGAPLTSVAAVEAAELVTAEMRDGATVLRSVKTD